MQGAKYVKAKQSTIESTREREVEMYEPERRARGERASEHARNANCTGGSGVASGVV